MKPTATPDEILNAMRIPMHETAYAIGIFEERINIYSQQIRAFNLAHALIETFNNKVKNEGLYELKNARIGIIGGGVSGITLASALATQEYRIDLFEEREVLFPLQRDSDRYIHPNINKWPDASAFIDKTDLPFMNWVAGTIKDKLNEFEDFWDSEVDFKKNIKVFNKCQIKKIRQKSGIQYDYSALEYYDENTRTLITDKRYQAVIFAGGFGEEKKEMNINGSYWMKDTYKHSVTKKNANRPINIRIYGNGDSGLIDAVRLSLRKYEDYRAIYRILEGNENIKNFGIEMKKFDETIKNTYDEQQRKDKKDEISILLLEKMEELYTGDFGMAEIADDIIKKFVPNDKINLTLIGYTKSPYSLNTLLMNRFFVFILSKKLNNFKYKIIDENLYKVDSNSGDLNKFYKKIAKKIEILPKSWFLNFRLKYGATIIERSGPMRIYNHLFYDSSDSSQKENFDKQLIEKKGDLLKFQLGNFMYWTSFTPPKP